MANIKLKRYNGSSWDTINPETTWSQIQSKPSTFTPTSHTHTLSQISDAGTVAAVDLNSSTTQFLRGDGTFAAPNINGGNAQTLDNLDSTAFLRADQSGTLSGSLEITGDLEVLGNTIGFIDSNFDAKIEVSDSNPNGTGAVFNFYGDGASRNATLSAEQFDGNAATATKLLTARTIAGVSFDGSANISLNNNAITNGAGYTTNVGDITQVTAGTGLSGGGTSGAVTLNLDLSEFTDMTADVNGLQDELILLDNGAERRKAIAEIKLSQFNNDAGFTSNSGDITAVTAGSGLSGGGTSGGVTLSHADTSSQASVNNSGRTYIQDITLDTYGHITGITSATETVVNTDTNTTYSAGTGLALSGTTFNLDFSELQDITLDVTGTSEMILQVGSTEGRKALSEIDISVFNNDSGFTSNSGDITNVTAGTGLTGGGASGSVTVNAVGGTGITANANDLAISSTFSPRTATELTSSQDLNDLKGAQSGFYYQTANADTTGNNYPSGEAGSLLVQRSAGQVTQTYITYSTTPKVYVRTYYTSWSAWKRLFTDDYHPNADTLTTARNIALTGAVTGNANFNGSSNISIATTATADPTLTLSGDVTGSATFTNLGNATLTATVADDSHNHIIANVDGLQTALDSIPTNNNQLTNGAGYTTNVGDITGVTAGTGLSGGGTSGSVTLNLDFSELSDITLPVGSTSEMILQVGSTEGRKALGEIDISVFNNDAGYTTNTGDILSVTAGSGLSGGGTSGGVTLSHADTSSQASVNNSGSTFIQDITLDTYGHITGITSATASGGGGVTSIKDFAGPYVNTNGFTAKQLPLSKTLSTGDRIGLSVIVGTTSGYGTRTQQTVWLEVGTGSHGLLFAYYSNATNTLRLYSAEVYISSGNLYIDDAVAWTNGSFGHSGSSTSAIYVMDVLEYA